MSRRLDENAPNCYIYAHFTLDSNKIFYIGKGTHKKINKYARAFNQKTRTQLWHKIANKHGLLVRVIEDNLIESQAFELEQFVIKEAGRINLKTGFLANLTDGGEGMNGHIRSEKTKAKTFGKNNCNAIRVKNQFGEIFETQNEAGLKYGFSASSIGICLSGKRRSSGKKDGVPLQWKYFNDESPFESYQRYRPIWTDKSRTKLSEKLKGRKLSEDHKNKFKKPRPEIKVYLYKPVTMYNATTNDFICEYESSSQAALALGVSRNTICANLKKRSKTVKNKFVFKYKEV